MSSAPQSPSSAVSQPVLLSEPVSLSMVVLFTDLVDSTSWKSLIGDSGYPQHVLQPHNELFVRLLRDYPGAALRNFMGDGFLAKFEKASDAVSFALRFQYELNALDWHASVRDAKRLVRTRVGIHQGEAIEYPDTAAALGSGGGFGRSSHGLGRSRSDSPDAIILRFRSASSRCRVPR